MIQKTYNVSEIFLSKEEIDMAIKEYIENHNNPPISYPKNVTHVYNLQGNRLNGISVRLVFENSEEIQNGLITELQEEESFDQGLRVTKSKKKKNSKPLFQRSGLLSEKVRLKF